jgi:hypothetical protein
MHKIIEGKQATRWGGLLAGALLLAGAAAVTACGGDESASASQGNGANEAANEQAIETFRPAEFGPEITNPYFPLPVGMSRVYEGDEEGTQLRVEEEVLPDTHLVAGVETRIVEVNEFEDGELVEHTLDYYAQHDDGSVWYFGEDVDDYENGEIVGHKGAWLAGQDGALPGLFMPANPEVGQKFEQERAPGVAEDESEIVEAGLSLEVPAGAFEDCIKTDDFAPLDNARESKFYCPDVGPVREQSDTVLLELIQLAP